MRIFISYLKIIFKDRTQYKIAAYAGIIVQFCWAVMNILLYKAFYKNSELRNVSFNQLVSYIWLQQAFYSLFATWSLDNNIMNCIINGSIAYELCRPIELYNIWYYRNIAGRIAKTLQKCIPIIIIASFFPGEFRLTWNLNLTTYLFFLLSMILSLGLVVAFCMLIYLIIFYTVSPLGIKMIFSSLIEFLVGGIIPIFFFPNWLQKILKLSPFPYLQNTPLRIFSGNIEKDSIIFSIIMQCFWLFLFIIIGKFLFKKALKKVMILGG